MTTESKTLAESDEPRTRGDVTRLLADWSDGEPEALDRLMPLVFEDLRRLARGQFRAESPSHTLQATELVSEVYVRLTQQHTVSWDNRGQFFAFAAQLMRRFLIDYAHRRRAAKRGGHLQKLPLDESLVVSEGENLDLVALDEALNRLEAFSPRAARVVELRFFVGLTAQETAEVLDIGVATVKRDWRTARLWLLREIGPKSTVD